MVTILSKKKKKKKNPSPSPAVFDSLCCESKDPQQLQYTSVIFFCLTLLAAAINYFCEPVQTTE